MLSFCVHVQIAKCHVNSTFPDWTTFLFYSYVCVCPPNFFPEQFVVDVYVYVYTVRQQYSLHSKLDGRNYPLCVSCIHSHVVLYFDKPYFGCMLADYDVVSACLSFVI